MIQCRVIYNTHCLKCDVVEKEMVRIGTYFMCHYCFETEFNVEAFEPESKLGDKYYKWLKIYKEKK